MTKAVLGIVGGSGIYDLPGLQDVREEPVQSDWGEPSAAVSYTHLTLPTILLV